jgi:chorismate--pyruvate lyase
MPNLIRHHRHEVATERNLHQWQTVSELPAHQVPNEIAPWLVDHGSLTERLIALSDNRFELVVLNQCRQLPHESESAALGLASDEWALVRQVCLYGRGEPWVFARSTIPDSTLASRADLGDRLDNQPLGHWIFNAPDLTRYPLQATCLEPGTSWLPAHLRGNRELWARRSIFALGEHPLLICEVFLPDFPAYRSQGSS